MAALPALLAESGKAQTERPDRQQTNRGGFGHHIAQRKPDSIATDLTDAHSKIREGPGWLVKRPSRVERVLVIQAAESLAGQDRRR